VVIIPINALEYLPRQLYMYLCNGNSIVYCVKAIADNQSKFYA